MPGLDRRRFLRGAAVLAAATGIDLGILGPALAADTQSGRASAGRAARTPSTLLQTVLQGSVSAGQYRTLTAGPGEPYIPRLDVLRRRPSPGRVTKRRSLLYLGHLSDMHVIDAQSPCRIEPMIVQDHSAWGSAFHPHDPMSPHTTAAMITAFSDARYSPLTGVPMSAAVVTGDSADMHSSLELRWYIDLMDGLAIDPASAGATYQGLQAWSEATWAYRPADPAGGPFGDYGFPRLPDLLGQVVARPIRSPGIPAPWYAVYGNHDTLLLGTFTLTPQMHAMAVGGQKSYTLDATATSVLTGYAAANSAVQQGLNALRISLGGSGFKPVPANPERHLFEQRDFMAEHFITTTNPGPKGHGFTQANLDSGQTWWSADLSDHVRVLGLDTCNQVAGPDGAVPQSQFEWVESQLKIATAQQRLVVILSHHNSVTLENRAQRPGHTEKLYGAAEFVDLVLRYPMCVAWLNGHTHLNQILPHTSATTGFWEITTASCIDFPQQQQVVEIVDNADGTLSLFTTVLDHASPVAPEIPATTQISPPERGSLRPTTGRRTR